MLAAGLVLLIFDLLPWVPFRVAFFYGGIICLVFFALLVFANPLKWRTAADILDSLEWRGDERVLDVGCGRGLWLVNAAKHLRSGLAVGVDTWSGRLQSGNNPERTLENAEIEGVADRVEVKDGEAQQLPFGDASFDLVISSLVVHHVPKQFRNGALREMVRVLRPGGGILMLEIFGEVQVYEKAFGELGMVDIRTTWSKPLSFLGYRLLKAKKPKS